MYTCNVHAHNFMMEIVLLFFQGFNSIFEVPVTVTYRCIFLEIQIVMTSKILIT